MSCYESRIAAILDIEEREAEAHAERWEAAKAAYSAFMQTLPCRWCGDKDTRLVSVDHAVAMECGSCTARSPVLETKGHRDDFGEVDPTSVWFELEKRFCEPGPGIK